MAYVDILKFDEAQHPRGKDGKFTRSPAHQAYVDKYPQYTQEADAFATKYPRKAQMDFETRQVKDAIPSGEFQREVEIAGHKRRLKEHREAKAAARAGNKPVILGQLKEKYGLSLDDEVYDRESGTKGVVRWGRDGQPYVQSAMGKHLVGARWQKKAGG